MQILGIDSEFCIVESFITGIVDYWPDTLRPHRIKFTIAICLIMFALGIPMVTNVSIQKHVFIRYAYVHIEQSKISDKEIKTLYLFREEFISSNWWTSTPPAECLFCGCVSSKQSRYHGFSERRSSVTVCIRWWAFDWISSGIYAGLYLRRWSCS